MTADECFEALGIAPTMDAAAVKRAYFTSLKAHPPHLDAVAFRRVRNAYEQLGSASSLVAAYMASSVEIAATVSEQSAGLERALDAIAAEVVDAQPTEALRARFVATVPALTWSAALARFGQR